MVGILGCLFNILFCPYKSFCPKRIQFHSVIYSLPHSYVLQENCALSSALDDSEAIMTTTFLGTSQMGLVICMWANAAQEPLRKSSRDFLRKRSINKQMVPPPSSEGYSVWMGCTDQLQLSSTSLRMRPAQEGQDGDNHRLVDLEPLRTGQSLSYQ